MKKDIKISVVVCCYHGVKTVYKALESLNNQDLNKGLYEVIIIDNGSIDGSSSQISNYIQEYEPINFLVFRIVNEGLSNARNYGFNKASGEIIFYIDDDAFADHKCLGEILKEFNNKDVNVVGGKVDILNKNNLFAMLYHHSIFRYWLEKIGIIIGTNMSIRKSLLINTGGFIKDLKYRGDESAFFEKNKKLIKNSINQNILVYHTQPEKLDLFLKSRYENGSSKAFLNFTFPSVFFLKKIKINLFFLIRLFSVFFLLLILVLYYIGFNPIWIKIILIIFIFRYILHQDFLGSLAIFLKSSPQKSKIIYIPYIVFFIILGAWLEDFGYVKTYIKTILNIN